MANTPQPASPTTDGPLFECVPNVSEGRNRARIERIVESMRSAGARIVDVHSDPDHHRSVLTCFGTATELWTACERTLELLAGEGALADHRGEHPRTGLLDVVPLVPLDQLTDIQLSNSTLQLAARLAREGGQQLALNCGVPVYFYEAAAADQARRNLADHRRALRDRPTDRSLDDWPPDCGPLRPHATAGVSIVGARRPLVAFNVDLEGGDLRTARRIASRIRASSRHGLPGVKSIGLFLPRRGRAQVSINLVDDTLTTLPLLVDRIRYEAERVGAATGDSELIGLATLRALDGCDPEMIGLRNFDESSILEHQLAKQLPNGRP